MRSSSSGMMPSFCQWVIFVQWAMRVFVGHAACHRGVCWALLVKTSLLPQQPHCITEVGSLRPSLSPFSCSTAHPGGLRCFLLFLLGADAEFVFQVAGIGILVAELLLHIERCGVSTGMAEPLLDVGEFRSPLVHGDSPGVPGGVHLGGPQVFVADALDGAVGDSLAVVFVGQRDPDWRSRR